jgi:uncharacterized phage protein (predicted DNA packaging)
LIIDLPLAKKFLRMDSEYTDEDDLLTLMIDNAEIHIKNSVENLDENNQSQMKQARLLALILVTDFYDNRELTGKVSDKIRDSVQATINQLKYCYPGGTV